MDFLVAHRDDGTQARVGQISWRNQPERNSVSTPAPLLLTRRGALPNLPMQIWRMSEEVGSSTERGAHDRDSGVEERVLGWEARRGMAGRVLCVQVPVLDFLSLNATAGLTGDQLLTEAAKASSVGDYGIADFADLSSALTVLSLRAAGSEDFLSSTTSAARKNYISGEVRGGASRIPLKPDDVVKLQRAMRCDLFEAPSITMLAYASTKAVAKSVDSSAAMLDETIRLVNEMRCSGGLLGTIQGGVLADQRLRSAELCKQRESSVVGLVVGGLGTTETNEEREDILRFSLKEQSRPMLRISTGRGTPEEVLLAVREGIDLIESSYPFDLAEEGFGLNLEHGHSINLYDRKLELDDRALVPNCRCYTCRSHSRAYLHHLHNVHEMLAVTLLTVHNLHNFLAFFDQIQASIQQGVFREFIQHSMGSRSPWHSPPRDGS